MGAGLRDGLPAGRTVHLCIDMQALFGAGSPWAVPWMEEILPVVARLAGVHADHTVFTRFLTARSPQAAPGSWRAVYAAWPEVTRDRLDPARLELMPPLARLVPPGRIFDKPTYSPWPDGMLHRLLSQARVTTLVVSGGETDVCVLAAVLGAIDRGYRVVLATDGVCSSFDATHDAMLELYRMRFSHQLETAATDEILDAWPAG